MKQNRSHVKLHYGWDYNGHGNSNTRKTCIVYGHNPSSMGLGSLFLLPEDVLITSHCMQVQNRVGGDPS